MDHIALLKHVIGNLRAGLSEGQGLVRSGFGFCDPCEVNLDRPDIYELAPVKHIVNGIQVPLPLDKEPECGSMYWCESPENKSMYCGFVWTGNADDRMRFERKICYSTSLAASENCMARYGFS